MVLFKISKNSEKRCGRSPINGIYLKKIKFLNFYLAANLCIHYSETTLRNLRKKKYMFCVYLLFLGIDCF